LAPRYCRAALATLKLRRLSGAVGFESSAMLGVKFRDIRRRRAWRKRVAVGEIDVGKVDVPFADVGSVSSVTEPCRRRR